MRSAQRGIPFPLPPARVALGGNHALAQGHDAMTRQEEEREKTRVSPLQWFWDHVQLLL